MWHRSSVSSLFRQLIKSSLNLFFIMYQNIVSKGAFNESENFTDTIYTNPAMGMTAASL